jgi:hypothetical protein
VARIAQNYVKMRQKLANTFSYGYEETRHRVQREPEDRDVIKENMKKRRGRGGEIKVPNSRKAKSVHLGLLAYVM